MNGVRADADLRWITQQSAALLDNREPVVARGTAKFTDTSNTHNDEFLPNKERSLRTTFFS